MAMNNTTLLAVLFSAVISLFTVCAKAQSLQQVEQSLIKDIQSAQKRLSQVEQKIARESSALGQAIRARQQDVIRLREQAAAQTRLVDDQTLALSDIQSRLQKWQQQDAYQKRLLMDLVGRNGEGDALVNQTSRSLVAGIPALSAKVSEKQQSLKPKWVEQEVMLDSGKLVTAEVLTVGPNRWFLEADGSNGGLLNEKNAVIMPFTGNELDALNMLRKEGKAVVTVDPSLGAAIKLEQQNESAWEHLQRGGVWAVPIVLFGFFALLIGVAKGVQIWRLPKLDPLFAERIALLEKNENTVRRLTEMADKLQGAQRELVTITLSTPHGEKRDDSLIAYLLEYRRKLQANLGAIAITASVAPLLGLLGTVSGMIETFNMMNLFGSGDPAVVSGGISKALITTELGLIVAIPALVMHALLTRVVRNHHTQLDSAAIRMGKLETSLP